MLRSVDLENLVLALMHESSAQHLSRSHLMRNVDAEVEFRRHHHCRVCTFKQLHVPQVQPKQFCTMAWTRSHNVQYVEKCVR